MAAGANSTTRHKNTLAERKTRAEGRHGRHRDEDILDASDMKSQHGMHPAGGATGTTGRGKSRPGGTTDLGNVTGRGKSSGRPGQRPTNAAGAGGGGGGGGSNPTSKSDFEVVGTSKRPAKKRGANTATRRAAR